MAHTRHTLYFTAALVLAPAVALACTPATPHGDIALSFPLAGATDHPINAPVLVNWEDTTQSFHDDNVESVPISMKVFPVGQETESTRPIQYKVIWGTSGQVQFDLDRDLLPDTDYAMVAHVDSEWIEHEPEVWNFRTGSGRIDYPIVVDFAGISSLSITERAVPRSMCCQPEEVGACADCYQVGWDYPKVIEARFDVAPQPHPMRYAFYEHDSDNPQSRRTRIQYVYPQPGSSTISWQLPLTQSGTCVSVVAQPYDAVGASDGDATTIVCTAPEDLRPIERLPENFEPSPCDKNRDFGHDLDEEPDPQPPHFTDDHGCTMAPSQHSPAPSGAGLCGLLFGLCAWRRRRA